MEEENQQQVKQEPQRVTTKDPKKVEAGKRLAAISHKKREAKKREEQVQLEKIGANQYYRMGSPQACRAHWGRSSCVSDRWSWLLHLSKQERTSEFRSTR